MPTLRATTSFAAAGRRHVNEGDIVDASDPVVSGREHLFESAERATSAPVEQATAAPGERRTVQRAEHVCDICGDTAKTAAGLAAHKRSHDED